MHGFPFTSLTPLYKSIIVPRDRFPLFRLKSDGLFLLFLIFFILYNTSCHVLRFGFLVKVGPVGRALFLTGGEGVLKNFGKKLKFLGFFQLRSPLSCLKKLTSLFPVLYLKVLDNNLANQTSHKLLIVYLHVKYLAPTRMSH